MSAQLCKFKARELGIISNSRDWEYGILTNTNNKDKNIYTIVGLSSGRATTHSRDWNDNNIKLLGDLKIIENQDLSIINIFNKLIQQLEIPTIEELLKISSNQTISLEVLNTPMDEAEFVSKVSIADLRKEFITISIFSEYMKTLLEHLIDINNATEKPIEDTNLQELDEELLRVAIPEVNHYITTSNSFIAMNSYDEFKNDSERDNEPPTLSKKGSFGSYIVREIEE